MKTLILFMFNIVIMIFSLMACVRNMYGICEIKNKNYKPMPKWLNTVLNLFRIEKRNIVMYKQCIIVIIIGFILLSVNTLLIITMSILFFTNRISLEHHYIFVFVHWAITFTFSITVSLVFGITHIYLEKNKN